MKRVIAFLLSVVLVFSVMVQDAAAFEESMMSEKNAAAGFEAEDDTALTNDEAELYGTPDEADDTEESIPADDAFAEEQQDEGALSDEEAISDEAEVPEEELLTDEGEEREMPDYSELCGYFRDPDRPVVESMSVYATDQDENENEERLGAGSLPSSYKTEDHQDLPALRFQTGGTCWAHAAIASSEINMIKQGLAQDPDWSEYHLAYFRFYRPVDPLGGTEGDRLTKEGTDIYGGFDSLFAANTLASWVGVSDSNAALEPETVRNNGIDPSLAYVDIAHLKNFYVVNASSAEGRDAVKQIVMDHGAAVCDYCQPEYNYSNYNSTYNSYYNPSSMSSNHAVTVVGWDDNFPRTHFNSTPAGDGAWLIRNSWYQPHIDTSEYCYDGYFWLSYYDKSLGAEFYGYEYETSVNYDNNYQYDGAAGNFEYTVSSLDSASMANVFCTHASPRGETLKAASFYTNKSNLNYEVCVFKDLEDPADPVSGSCVAVESGSTTYPGYYTVPLTTPVEMQLGDVYSIVVTLKKTGERFNLVREGGVGNGSFFTVAASRSGQSFWLDAMDQWTDVGADGRGNIRIKAFTDDNGSASGSSYDVVFHANHNTNEYVCQSIGQSDTVALRMNTFEREGYHFANWNTKPDGSGIAYADGKQVNGLATGGGRVDLYAQWTENEYTVTLNANGGSCATTSVKATYGSTYDNLPQKAEVTIPAAYSGHQNTIGFSGWYTAAEGGEEVDSSTIVTQAKDHTLFSRWSYQARLHANGGYFNGSSGQYTDSSKYLILGNKYDSLYSVKAPVREGYQFAGWYTEESGGERLSSTDTITASAKKDIYAHWTTADTYTVKLLPNGGRVLEPTATVTYGENYGDLPKPFRTGYYFAGWYTEKTGGVKIDSETIVSVDNFDLSASEHNLYARWIPCRYKVIFNGNGGSISSKFKYVTFGEKYGALPQPKRTGYTFIGWYKEPEGTTKVSEDTEVTRTDDHTLYAKWSAKRVTVRCVNGTELVKTLNLTYGGTYGGAFGNLPVPDAAPAGMEFAGWYTSETGGTKVEAETVVETEVNHTIYARWTGRKYEVRLNAEGGTLLADKLTGEIVMDEPLSSDSVERVFNAVMQVQYGKAFGLKYAMDPRSRVPVPRMPVPVREGYAFAGWYTSETGGTMIKADTIAKTPVFDPSKNYHILYAHWEKAGFWVEGLKETYDYTGSAIKPVVTVHDFDHDRALTEKADYTVTYKNNTNAGTATIIITGKGNYTEKIEKTFQITAQDIGSDAFSADDIYAAYNKKGQTPNPVLLWNGKKLAKNKDYKVISWKNDKTGEVNGTCKEAGSYTVTLQGITNFRETRELKFVITEKTLLNTAKVTASNVPYPGDPSNPPTVTVKLGKNTVPEAAYDILWPGQTDPEDPRNGAAMTNAGTVNFTVVAKDGSDYAGSCKGSYKITGTALKPAWVTFNDPKKVYYYTGSAIMPGGAPDDKDDAGDITVYDPAKHANLNKSNDPTTGDYMVSYSANVDAGTATMTITGCGGYTGSVSKKFKIETAEDKSTYTLGGTFAETLPYVKGGTTQADEIFDTMKIGGLDAVIGRDYTVAYRNNKKPGDASATNGPRVVVTGKGNFKGFTLTRAFTITAQDISGKYDDFIKAYAPNMVYTGKAGGYAVTPTLIDRRSGLKLDKSDYNSKVTYHYKEITTVKQIVKKETVNVTRTAGEKIDKADIIPAGTELFVRVTGINGYAGIRDIGYRVSEGDFSKLKIKVADQYYTGRSIEIDEDDITFTMPAGVETPVMGKDYEIAGYGNNLNKGNATVILRGLGNYAGLKSVTFKIVQRTIYEKKE